MPEQRALNDLLVAPNFTLLGRSRYEQIKSPKTSRGKGRREVVADEELELEYEEDDGCGARLGGAINAPVIESATKAKSCFFMKKPLF